MNPQTTNRTTEDTNILNKKILSRDGIDMGTPSSSGGYYTYSVTVDIPYQKAGTNNYCLDGFLDYRFTAFVFYVRPINHMQINPTTGKIIDEMIATMNSYVNPQGNFLEVTYRLFTTSQPYAINYTTYPIIYSTSVTEGSIW